MMTDGVEYKYDEDGYPHVAVNEPPEPSPAALTSQIMPLSPLVVRTSASEAAERLYDLSGAIHAVNAANVYYRFHLGRQLLEIRDKKLWRERPLWNKHGTHPEEWTSWMTYHFAEITGFSKETGFGAMQIASCKILQDLSNDDLRSFENLANAILLARVERERGKVGDDLLDKALTLPVKEFRVAAGAPVSRGQASVVTQRPEQATPLQSLMERFKDADAPALAELSLLVENEVAPRCGDNPTDMVDFFIAALTHEVGAHTLADQPPPSY